MHSVYSTYYIYIIHIKYRMKIIHIIYRLCSVCTECNYIGYVHYVQYIFIFYSVYSLHNITFFKSIPYHCCYQIKFPHTRNKYKKRGNSCSISSTKPRLCGHRQWQCAACSTVCVVQYVRTLSTAGQTGSTKGKCQVVRRFIFCRS